MTNGKSRAKMFYALHRMAANNGRRKLHSARLYQFFRQKFAYCISGSNNTRYGSKQSNKTKKILSEKAKQRHRDGRARPPGSFPGEKNGMYGKKHSQTVKDSIAKRNAKKFVVLTPENKELEITNLEKFCRDNTLDLSGMWATFYGRKAQHKGYKLLRRVQELTLP